MMLAEFLGLLFEVFSCLRYIPSNLIKNEHIIFKKAICRTFGRLYNFGIFCLITTLEWFQLTLARCLYY